MRGLMEDCNETSTNCTLAPDAYVEGSLTIFLTNPGQYELKSNILATVATAVKSVTGARADQVSVTEIEGEAPNDFYLRYAGFGFCFEFGFCFDVFPC